MPGDMSELKEQLTRRTGGKLNIKARVRIGIFFHQELKTVANV
jgi:hypothetical protein